MKTETWRPSEPLPSQLEVLASRSDHIYFRAGLGSGKTWTGAIWAAAQVALHSPKARGLIVAPTYGMLRDVTQAAIEELWPRCVVDTFHGTELAYRWPNGSRVLLRSADRPGRIRGVEVAWAWLDEPGECKPEIWQTLPGRVRQQSRRKRQILVTGTPDGFNWCHDYFGEPGQRETVDGVDLHVVQARTADNPHLPPEYLASLQGIFSDRMAAQELEGSVVQLEGQVFSEYSPAVHVVPFEVDKAQPTWAGLDFGYRQPAVNFWQKMPGRKDAWICVGELMPRDCTTEQLGNRIVAEGWNLQEVWCDPAGDAATTAGRTDIQALRRLRIPAKYRVNSQVRRIAFGLEVMRAAMSPADGSEPRLLVAQHVANKGGARGLHRSLLSYSYKGRSDKPDKDGESDHAVDAARYFWANVAGVQRARQTGRKARGAVQMMPHRMTGA